MPYRSLTITPIMEQSDTSDPQNQVYKVALHFKLWDKNHLFGEITYIHSQKLKEDIFTYGNLSYLKGSIRKISQIYITRFEKRLLEKGKLSI
jgi:hypothetical protein